MLITALALVLYLQAARTAPRVHPVITSRAELAIYLRDTPLSTSPLRYLSPGGRKRFLAELEFGPKGLATLSTGDPAAELTHPQIVALFSLFGVEQYAEGLGLSPAERARRMQERAVAANKRGCSIGKCPETTIEKQFDTLMLHGPSRSLSLPQQAAAFAHEYEQLFAHYGAASTLKPITSPDLRLLKRAVGNVLFYVPSVNYVERLRSILAEMRQRNMTSDQDYKALYKGLIAARQFDQAHVLVQRHPGMSVASLPTFREPGSLPRGQPTALAISPDGRTMTRRAFNLHAPLTIVVVASCHFSKDAAREIAQEPKLKDLFARHAVWLADQSDSIGAAKEWNSEFPDQPIYIAWRDSEWSMLDKWAMPTFYIFRDGALVDRWSGWPATSTALATLRKHLRTAGLQ